MPVEENACIGVLASNKGGKDDENKRHAVVFPSLSLSPAEKEKHDLEVKWWMPWKRIQTDNLRARRRSSCTDVSGKSTRSGRVRFVVHYYYAPPPTPPTYKLPLLDKISLPPQTPPAMADHAQEQQEVQYQPQDAIGGAVKATMVTGAAGLFVSTIQNTLTKQNVGAFGVFTRSGSTVAVFAAMGGVYQFTKDCSSNLREKDDALNSTLGGFMAGTMMGLRFRSMPGVFGYGTALAAILGAFSFTGGKLSGSNKDRDHDEVARKMAMRKNRRRPLEETVHELGEGRGVYAPGYEERRAQRIKEAYNIDVPPPSSRMAS
nr:nadh-ubiquinone oxidoreductase 21.3 kda subunit [Quercus suber]